MFCGIFVCGPLQLIFVWYKLKTVLFDQHFLHFFILIGASPVIESKVFNSDLKLKVKV